MSFYEPLGFLAFGSRLRRLSETFLSEINKVYQHLGIDFEASWFPLFYLISTRQPVAITDVAATLEISHSAVSQLAGVLKAKGLVISVKSIADERRQLLQLTDGGVLLLQKLLPVWQAVTGAMQALADQHTESQALLTAFTAFESALLSSDLRQLIEERVNLTGPEERQAQLN